MNQLKSAHHEGELHNMQLLEMVSTFTNPQHLKTLALDPRQELAHILRQEPRFILTVNRYRHRALHEALRRDYRRLKVFYRRYNIYERK